MEFFQFWGIYLDFENFLDELMIFNGKSPNHNRKIDGFWKFASGDCLTAIDNQEW